MASRSALVPRAFVYFVKPSSMARFAAAEMESGVPKSGSPGPKSTMSIPRACSSCARLSTASVGDTSMSRTRRVRRIGRLIVVVTSIETLPSCESPRERFSECDPCRRLLAADQHPHQLDNAPRQVNLGHHIARRRHDELDHPKREQDQRFVKAQLEIQQQQKSEKA